MVVDREESSMRERGILTSSISSLKLSLVDTEDKTSPPIVGGLKRIRRSTDCHSNQESRKREWKCSIRIFRPR